jgi:hypothetical protein
LHAQFQACPLDENLVAVEDAVVVPGNNGGFRAIGFWQGADLNGVQLEATVVELSQALSSTALGPQSLFGASGGLDSLHAAVAYDGTALDLAVGWHNISSNNAQLLGTILGHASLDSRLARVHPDALLSLAGSVLPKLLTDVPFTPVGVVATPNRVVVAGTSTSNGLFGVGHALSFAPALSAFGTAFDDVTFGKGAELDIVRSVLVDGNDTLLLAATGGGTAQSWEVGRAPDPRGSTPCSAQDAMCVTAALGATGAPQTFAWPLQRGQPNAQLVLRQTFSTSSLLLGGSSKDAQYTGLSVGQAFLLRVGP